MSDPIKFRHRYNKLSQPVFTTIRGKAQFKRLKIGQHVDIESPDGNFKAKVLKLELKRVADMDIAFLKADAEYPGFVISDKTDFIKLLNSFRSPAWSQVALDSELTIITLQEL